MTPHDPTDALRGAWKADEEPLSVPPVDEIRRRADHSRRVIGRRNLREYVAGAFVSLFFCVEIVRGGFNGWVDVGPILLVLAAVYVMYRLWRHGGSNPLPAELGAVDAVTFYRSELVRQRDLLRNIWWWYLLPFIPGFVVTIGARAMQQRVSPWRTSVAAAVVSGITWLVWWMNQRAADRLQLAIDALQRPDGSPLTAPPGPALVERVTLWAFYASMAAVASSIALTFIGLDPVALVPGLGALSPPTRRWIWFGAVFAVCLVWQAVRWARTRPKEARARTRADGIDSAS